MVGNKCDMKEQYITVSEAMEFALEEETGYMEVSAALNINIERAF